MTTSENQADHHSLHSFKNTLKFCNYSPINTLSLIKKNSKSLGGARRYVIRPGKANKLTRRNILLTQRYTCNYKSYT